jgi:hypothetical protein
VTTPSAAGRTSVVDAVAPGDIGPGRRHRAWLRAACVLLVVAIYLNLWTAYALNGLTAHGRYRQLEAGQPVTSMGAEFRLVGLVRTTQLVNSITDEVSTPPANAVWLIARIEVTRVNDDPDLLCAFEVLGPQRRIWEPDSGLVSRDAASTCDADAMPIGRAWPIEVVFQVPERYLGDLAGITVNDPTSRAVRPVLTPPG